MFDLEQAWTAFSDVVSSLLIIVLAIVALEALLYLALMARRGERGTIIALIVAPLTAAGAYLLLSLETLSLDGLTSLSSDTWTSLVVIVGVVIVLAGATYFFWARRRTVSARLALPAMLLAPAFVGIGLLYVYPLLYELNLSFTKMSVRNFVEPGLLGKTWEGTILEPFGAERDIFVGLDNYVNVFTKPILQQTGFWQLFGQTIVWTVVCIFFHVTLGVALALHAQPQDARPHVLSRSAHPAVGHPHLHLVADLANGVQLPVRRRQPVAERDRHRTYPVDDRSVLELHGHDHHQRLAGRALHDGHHPRRPAGHLQRLLRGRGDRRRQRPAAVLPHHRAAAAPGAGAGSAAWACS